MRLDRRQFLTATALGLAAAPLAARPGLAAAPAPAPQKLKVGYLHTLSCDGHLWLGEHLGAFKQEGLEVEALQFVTGLEAYQALAGGSVDVVTTGAVISNFPARGQGKVFLINGLETGIAQIWVDPKAGISTLADLKGKQVATTRGTTAHFFLHRALKSVGLDSTKDVEIVHQRLDQAVTAFISGSVPAVVLWVPLDTPIRQRRPDAVLLAKSGDFPDATVVDGWSARNALPAENPALLERVVRAWARANDFLLSSPDQALAVLAAGKYKDFTVEELKRQAELIQYYPTNVWPKYYSDGSIVRWLNQVTDFNQEVGAIKDPIRAETYFDPKIFLAALA
ncbi:ABC transporter substrate-binding protein [Xanthobacter sp. V4C-4]|uniref:ABC transporter substrate-binding protein n=1 Tax=Xanthobacter cornucopiae TaxID=3119924 RepID=UPI00372BC252